MITVYLWGEDRFFTSSLEVEQAGAMPERSTPTAPPKLEGAEIACWTGDGWKKLAQAPQQQPATTPDWPALIATRRYRAEISGIWINSIQITTDDRSKLQITGAALEAMLNPDYRTRWKTPNGFVELTAQELIAMARAVRAHIQSCFDREAELQAAVADGSITLEMLEQGWP